MLSDLKKPFHLAKALLAVLFYGFPARKLRVIAVTGTDGKTTTVNLIYHILRTSGKKVSAVSTVWALVGKRKIDTGFHTTTPGPFALQSLLSKMVKSGSEYAVIEATSHALDQYRLLGTNVYVGVLTNVTHEHLDYHGSFKKYLGAKIKLFKMAKIVVLNRLDKAAKSIASSLGRKKQIFFYPTQLSKELKKAVDSRFPVAYNKLNAQAAIKVAKVLGITESKIAKAVKSFPPIPGRMEEVKNRKGIRVFIDFAHTPNALESVLATLRKEIPKGKSLISVLGCAGERDKGKRPMMGEISVRLADISVFTAEDPRHEDVNKIIEEMVRGANRVKHTFFREPDRRKAIRMAIQKLAQKGDTIVVCGKGHEKTMNYGGIERPWSDKKAAEIAIKGYQNYTNDKNTTVK